MKKILLLGAGGFIGSHLAVELLKTENYDVTALDVTREKLNEGIHLAAELIFNNKGDDDALTIKAKINETIRQISYINLDIMEENNREELNHLVKENDIIVNMIAICNPALYIKDPILTYEVGFLGNLKVFEMCVENNKRLIQFSTSEVYGKSPSVYVKDKKFYFNEETSDLIMGPINKHRWIYASSKQLLERVIHAYGLKRDFHYSIIRPFNYIGERIDYLPSEKNGNPRVFSHFMDALINSESMQLVNGGMQKRCYTYVKDATDAHVRIINNQKNLCDRQIFNVGLSSNETTIKNLAKLMREIYEKHFIENGQKVSELVSIPGEEFYGDGYDDIDRRLLDNSKLIEFTGWKPQYDLKMMLYEIMKYYVGKVKNRN